MYLHALTFCGRHEFARRKHSCLPSMAHSVSEFLQSSCRATETARLAHKHRNLHRKRARCTNTTSFFLDDDIHKSGAPQPSVGCTNNCCLKLIACIKAPCLQERIACGRHCDRVASGQQTKHDWRIRTGCVHCKGSTCIGKEGCGWVGA